MKSTSSRRNYNSTSGSERVHDNACHLLMDATAAAVAGTTRSHDNASRDVSMPSTKYNTHLDLERLVRLPLHDASALPLERQENELPERILEGPHEVHEDVRVHLEVVH